MMPGWGEPRTSSAAARLAAAVRAWNRNRSVLNEERMVQALDDYDADQPAPPAAY